jgi:hypothetical protein
VIIKRFLFVLIILYSFLYPQITSYKFIKSLNKVTLSLYLDKYFDGNISKSIINDDVIIRINDKLSIKDDIVHIKNSIIPAIEFSYYKNSSQIRILKAKDFLIEVEKTFDGKNIKIDISRNVASSLFRDNESSRRNLAPSIGIGSYILMLSIISILLIVYFMVKRKTDENLKLNNLKGYKLIFVKQIDLKTKLIVFELNNKRYIVLSGNSFATLIDTIDSNSKDNFDFYLQQVENIKKEEDSNNP